MAHIKKYVCAGIDIEETTLVKIKILCLTL